MSPHGTSHPISNSILAKLPSELLAHLTPKLEEVELSQHKMLYMPDEPIGYAYFLQRGMISLVKRLEDGSMAEVGIIGNEGFVGIPLVLGASTDIIKSRVRA
jgi:CRP-like cAMP-binding protein